MNIKSNKPCQKRKIIASLFCTVGAATHLVLSPSVFGQEVKDIEKVVITGSRISGTNEGASQPLVVIGEKEFDDSGAMLVSEALNQLPQFGNSLEGGSSINALNGGFGVGTQTANLRNLGANRTLVLVNGRRHIGGDVGTSAVDLATIPSGLIERIDVVTGASSAVYGADAVTGVVNVVLKEYFEGTNFTVRGGGTSEGGGDEFELSATHGDILDKLDYIVAVEYSHQGNILGSDRDYAQLDGSPATGLADASGGSGVNPGGLYVSSLGGTGGFDPSGNFTQPFSERFQRMPFRSLQNKTERLVASSRVGYKVSGNMDTFLEMTYANTAVAVDIEPQLAVFSDGGFASSGTAGFRFPTAPTVPIASAGADLRAVTRRFSEFGPRSSEIERDLYRIATGFDMYLDFADVHVSYQYGRVEASQTDFDTINKLDLVTAIDPIACAGTTGCQFVDIYGRGTIDPASESSVSQDLVSNSKGEQHVLSAYITGDAFEFLGNTTGFALGLEYRDESAVITPNSALNAVIDPVTGSGNPVGLQGTRTFSGKTSGSYDVFEMFGELSVPLSERLDVNISARVSEYSTVGTEFTWGTNAQFRITDTLTFRGSVGSATRAPNVQELFSPDSASTSQIVDPCDTQTDSGDPLTQAAGCSAFVDTTFNPTDFDSNIRAVNGGNSELDSETADTYTLGAVYLPMDNTALSVDYFVVDMEDVLAPAFSAQATVINCIETGNDFFCDNVTRDAITGNVTGVRSEQVNLAAESIAGLEFAFNTAFAVGQDEISLSGTYTMLLERERQVNDTSDVEDLKNRIDNIEDKINVSLEYVTDRMSIGLGARYIGGGVQSANADPAIAIGNEVDSVTYIDLFGRYTISDNLTLRAGIENATNEEAPIVTSLFEGVGAGDSIAAGLYDVRGRYAYTSIEYSF
jgi:outer membrane receptor protein involved in Fe transport